MRQPYLKDSVCFSCAAASVEVTGFLFLSDSLAISISDYPLMMIDFRVFRAIIEVHFVFVVIENKTFNRRWK